jgi:polar amino acid transport system substrate-binding protein
MNRRMLSTAIAITAIAAATQVLADGGMIEKIKAAGVTKVSVGSAPPFVSITPTGEPTGYAVEVLQAVMAGLELPEIAPVKTDWSAMIPGLQAGQYDLVAPGLTITEERCNAIIFSAPVWSMQFGIYAKSGNPKGLETTTDFVDQADAKLAVLNGSSQDAYAVAQGVPDDQLERVTDVQAGVAAVRGGRADAFLVGRLTIPDPEGKGLTVVTDTKSPTFGYGIAFRSEDTDLRDAMNEQIDVLRENGELKAIYTKYQLPDWDMFTQNTRASDFYENCK